MKAGAKDKPKDTKKNPKELEAQRLEAERIAAETLKRQQEEECGLLRLIEGENIPMFLTQWFTTTAWSHEDPRTFTKSYLMRVFTAQKLADEITDFEIDMYANSILYNLVHAKDKLHLSDQATCYFLNLLFSVFVNQDSRFGSKTFEFLEDIRAREAAEEQQAAADKNKKAPEKDAKKKTDGKDDLPVVDESEPLDRDEIKLGTSLDQKSYEDDLSQFKQRLAKVCRTNPDLFDKSQIAQIISYAVESYFNNFRLYNFCQLYEQSEENLYLTVIIWCVSYPQVTIDEPCVSPPLEEARHVAKILTQEEKSALREQELQHLLEQERQRQDEIEQQRAEEQREYEEWMGLDEETIELIKQKLAETKKYMVESIEQKKQEFEEKAANSKVFKKKKK